MKLENQVCSLELTKKLKELGVPQDSLWYWVSYIGNYIGAHELRIENYLDVLNHKDLIEYKYSAFTVAEFGEMLPFRVRLEDDDYWLYISKGKGHWGIRYDRFIKPSMRHQPMGLPNKGFFQADTEANARAKMVIYLKENKL